MKKNLAKWSAGVAMFAAGMLGFTAGAMAAPYSVTYTDTVAVGGTLPSGINLGEQATVRVIFDNGNSSVVDQSWSADEVQCIIFTFNSAQDKFVAIDYSGNQFSNNTSGSFTTNGSGQLLAGSIKWTDDGNPITNPQKTNIPGTLSEWFLNGANGVIYWTTPSSEVDFSNVLNDDQVTKWSNPVPSYGVCGRSAAPTPVLNKWAMVVLSILLGFGGICTLHRQRQ